VKAISYTLQVFLYVNTHLSAIEYWTNPILKEFIFDKRIDVRAITKETGLEFSISARHMLL
jgi:hypothetical protein